MILKKGSEKVYGAFWRDESEGINTFFNNLKIRNKFSTMLYFHYIYIMQTCVSIYKNDYSLLSTFSVACTYGISDLPLGIINHIWDLIPY